MRYLTNILLAMSLLADVRAQAATEGAEVETTLKATNKEVNALFE